MGSCLNDVPQASYESGEPIILYYRSAFVKTVTVIKIEDNLVEIRSDNVSVITIVKDHVSNEASRLKIAFDLESNMVEEPSVQRVLELLHPLVQE